MPPQDASPTYLGDGLYVINRGWQLELYASNGIVKTDAVFLDGDVLENFLAYVEDLKKQVPHAAG